MQSSASSVWSNSEVGILKKVPHGIASPTFDDCSPTLLLQTREEVNRGTSQTMGFANFCGKGSDCDREFLCVGRLSRSSGEFRAWLEQAVF